MKNIRVMVVDDHPAFRAGLSRLLQEENELEVVGTSGDGVEAIKLAAEFKPDVIIMDVSMDGIDGIEAARLIKTNSPETDILIISAFSYPSYILGALKAGASGYLLKNTPFRGIIKAVRSISSGEAIFDMKVAGGLLRRLATDSVEKYNGLYQLQPRELQILSLVAKGKANKEIAILLDISERTVQTHLVNVFRKLQVNSRTEAVLQGLKLGWLTLQDLPDDSEIPGQD